MYTYTPIQQMAFPMVADVRKGTPKIEMERNNRKFFGLGFNLNTHFRISFKAGTDVSKAFYKSLYPDQYRQYDVNYKLPSGGAKPGKYAELDGFETKEIRAQVPAFSVFDCLSWANKANNSGTEIAVCDDDHYISLKNPNKTTEYQIQHGQPYRAFTHGDVLAYKNLKGETITLPFKSSLRLRLFLPQMEDFVYFELKSASIYDRWNLDAQLSAIQFWANTLNQGNAAGIPLIIYRQEQEITWNKPDGTAQRTKQWLINVKADPIWVRSAVERMSKMALGMDVQKMLNAPIPAPPLSGPYNPESQEDEEQPEGDLGDQGSRVAAPVIIEGKVTEIPPASKAMPRAGSAPSTPERTAVMAKFSAAWNLAAKDKLITPESQKIWGVSGSSTVDEIEAKTALIYTAIAARGEEKQNPPA